MNIDWDRQTRTANTGESTCSVCLLARATTSMLVYAVKNPAVHVHAYTRTTFTHVHDKDAPKVHGVHIFYNPARVCVCVCVCAPKYALNDFDPRVSLPTYVRVCVCCARFNARSKQQIEFRKSCTPLCSAFALAPPPPARRKRIARRRLRCVFVLCGYAIFTRVCRRRWLWFFVSRSVSLGPGNAQR